MFQKLNAHNNEWNRKYNFTEEGAHGFIMDAKLGLAFFAWKFSDGSIKYYKCERSVFDKNFAVTQDAVEHEMDPYENIAWLRYPVEV